MGIQARMAPCPYPLDGYANPDHLTYEREGEGHGILATLIVPFRGDDVPDVEAGEIGIELHDEGRALDPWEATALRIVINGEEHIHVDLHMAWNLPWTAGGWRNSHRLFNSSLENRSAIEDTVVNKPIDRERIPCHANPTDRPRSQEP
jgi:hypothetical protein